MCKCQVTLLTESKKCFLKNACRRYLQKFLDLDDCFKECGNISLGNKKPELFGQEQQVLWELRFSYGVWMVTPVTHIWPWSCRHQWCRWEAVEGALLFLGWMRSHLQGFHHKAWTQKSSTPKQWLLSRWNKQRKQLHCESTTIIITFSCLQLSLLLTVSQGLTTYVSIALGNLLNCWKPQFTWISSGIIMASVS